MGVPELKEKIRLRLETADERVLRVVASILDEQADNDIVAFSTQGKLLTIEDYNTKIDEAFSDLKNGNVFSNAEMKLKIQQLKRA